MTLPLLLTAAVSLLVGFILAGVLLIRRDRIETDRLREERDAAREKAGALQRKVERLEAALGIAESLSRAKEFCRQRACDDLRVERGRRLKAR